MPLAPAAAMPDGHAGAVRYRAAPAEALLVRTLDTFTAMFHRPSGQTHLLLEPAPEILGALGEEWLTLPDLAAALSARYDLDGADGLAERLEELAAAGLVETGLVGAR